MPTAAEANIARFGLPGATITAINQVFAAYPDIRRVVLYGSRAKGTHRPGSDIDLTLVGPEIAERRLHEIETRLDDLLLPWTIDLSLFHTLQNRKLIEHIERVGVTFYPEQGP